MTLRIFAVLQPAAKPCKTLQAGAGDNLFFLFWRELKKERRASLVPAAASVSTSISTADATCTACHGAGRLRCAY